MAEKTGVAAIAGDWESVAMRRPSLPNMTNALVEDAAGTASKRGALRRGWLATNSKVGGVQMGVAGWLSDLFNSRRSVDEPVMIARGRGYTFDIVGESQFQDELAQVAGPKTPKGAKAEKTAQIIVDDDNEHDENGIAVLIDGKVVGFIPRAVAVSTRAALARITPAGRPITCHAKIVGGWRDADGHEGHYGVKLSISNPIRLE